MATHNRKVIEQMLNILLHLDMGNGRIETIEEAEVIHLPRVNDTLRLLLPGDRKTSDYVVTQVRHEFTQGNLKTVKQAQIEISARRKIGTTGTSQT